MWEKIKFMASKMWEFLVPFIRIFLQEFGPVLAAAALNAVKTTQDSMIGATGPEKRDAAYKLIVEELKVKGITIGSQITTSMINAALEAAVQKLKIS